MKKILAVVLTTLMLVSMCAIFAGVFAGDNALTTGTITETGENAYTLGTEGLSAYINYRENGTDAKDIRFILVANLDSLVTYEGLYMTVTFKDAADAVVKSITFDVETELTFFATATAAGNTYTAAEGCAIFGVVIASVPNADWATAVVTLSETENGETFASGAATASDWVKLPETPEEIVNAAYALASGETLEGTYTLTGVITSVDTVYSSTYGNVTVTMVVGDMTDKPIQCFRLTGDGADVIGREDEITVTGTLKNYNGTIEFDADCTLDSYVDNVPAEETTIYTTPEEIVNAAYALDEGALLSDGHAYTLTGVVTNITGNNIVMVVGDMTTMPITCYRLSGDDVASVGVNDEITVTGTIKNYYGTIEFDSGCTLDAWVDNADPVVEGNVVKYEFSSYAAGSQYVTDERDLDDTLSISLVDGHLTSQLRLYDSSSHDSVATFTSTKAITGLTVNAGYKKGTMGVYVSEDGETWTLLTTISTTTTSYSDYVVDFGGESYKYFKLDPDGNQQIRIPYISVNYAE